MPERLRINGPIAKKIREDKKLTLDSAGAVANEQDVSLSKSTLQRIEKDTEVMQKAEIAEFLSHFLNVPLTVLSPHEEKSSCQIN